MRTQREGAQLQPRGMRSAGPGDDQARFLADLRALRDAAAVGYDELAARAHYPSDILKEAENGPGLPTLPILAAYVRACDGDVLEWEERWRRVANEISGDPGLPVRPAGASPAAVAGARAGVGVAPPDVYDPERIKAALRGGSQRSDRASQRTGTPGATASAVRDTGSGGTGWSFADAGPAGWNSTDAAPGWGATAWDTTTAPPTGWDTKDASPGFGATDGAAAGWGATDFPAAGWAATDPPANGWSAADAAPANGWSATDAPADGWSATDGAGTGWSATDAPADGWSATDGAGTGWSATDAPADGWSAADGAGSGLSAAEGAAGSWGTPDGRLDSAGWDASPGWSTAADQGITSANGTHQPKHRSGGPFGGAVDQVPELAERAETAEESQVADSWSEGSGLLADQPDSVSAWSDLPETELEPWSPGVEAAPTESASGELAWPELADTGLTPGTEADELAHPDPSGDELGWVATEAEWAPAEGDMTWSTADAGPWTEAEQVGQAAAAAMAEPAAWSVTDQALPQRVKPALASVDGSVSLGQADVRPEPQPAAISVASTQLQTAPESEERRQDRFYPLRLLVIIVIAALIGSGLVLLLK
jgi:hypothetical protein